ncbi:hypothetical protein KIS4809_4637 [Bacillus sp. ZZV12-4809]|nr:hypothetical protein KIS4809_4637 [Bacillus sp. ZZV12-4809]
MVKVLEQPKKDQNKTETSSFSIKNTINYTNMLKSVANSNNTYVKNK